MSVEKMALVLNHSKAPTPLARLVLVGIANHDGDGGAWPAISTLMRYTGASRSSVQRAIRLLEECGEIKVYPQEGGSRSTRSDRRPNRYEITVYPDNGVSSVTPRLTTNGVSKSAHGVSSVTPEPSLEPSSLKPSPRTSFSERGSEDLKLLAREAAAGYCGWYETKHGHATPTAKGRLGVEAAFLKCLRLGLCLGDIKRAAVAMDGAITSSGIVVTLTKLKAKTDGERWAVPQ